MVKFKTVTEESSCRDLWERFSPKELLWDLWDYRHVFHDKKFEFNFIVGVGAGKEIGLLPLVYAKKEDMYTYFGDMFPERNKFFLEDKDKLGKFLGSCPEGTSIYYIDSVESRHYDFDIGEKRYFLRLGKYGYSYENYLKSFSKKHRKNLNYDLRKLKERDCDILVNSVKDFDRLIELNRLRFGRSSDYSSKSFIKSMRGLVDISLTNGILDMISIRISGKTEAVGLGTFYNRCYYVLGFASNVDIKNLGKLLITEQIKSAISKKCSEIDFLSTDSNWKELWNLESEQMYEFYK